MFRILRVLGKEQRDAHDELFTKYGSKIKAETAIHNFIEQWTK